MVASGPGLSSNGQVIMEPKLIELINDSKKIFINEGQDGNRFMDDSVMSQQTISVPDITNNDKWPLRPSQTDVLGSL